MEASHFLQSRRSFAATLAHSRHAHEHNKLRHCSIAAVLTRPAENINIATGKSRTIIIPADVVTGAEEKSRIYNDNWFDRMAINHLSQNVQAATGLKNNKSGFESLVEAATATSRKFNPAKQRELVIQALDSAFPKPIFSLASNFVNEILLGKKKNPISWFLEETNCAGMCINTCKMPSQSFIKSSLGTPVNMVPNFDDMSCEMIFGQDPPELSDDPALKQPCFKLCKVNQRHNTNDCSK
ncbi:unnamed protein product [Prunus armeniaca]